MVSNFLFSQELQHFVQKKLKLGSINEFSINKLEKIDFPKYLKIPRFPSMCLLELPLQQLMAALPLTLPPSAG